MRVSGLIAKARDRPAIWLPLQAADYSMRVNNLMATGRVPLRARPATRFS